TIDSGSDSNLLISDISSPVGEWDESVGGGGSGTPAPSPAGVLSAYAGDTAPFGWLLADGSEVSRTTYSKLFAAISDTYGAGDGSTTFNLPDLRGRIPIGKDDMGGVAA